MMNKQDADLRSLMEKAMNRPSGLAYEGNVKEDQNLPGNIIVVGSVDNIYSFSEEDVLDREELSGGRTRVFIRIGAGGYRMTAFTVVREDMENIVPPPPIDIPGSPRRAALGEAEVKIAATLRG